MRDGVQRSTKPSSSIRRRIAPTTVRREAEVPLHPLAAQVEPAVAQAERLVHALLVELERQRRRARDDLQAVHLELDLAGREVRVHRVGRARTTSPSARRTNSLRTPCAASAASAACSGFTTSCVEPGVVAQVDEDQPAVVAARVRPPGQGQALPHVLGPRLAAHQVTPLGHFCSTPGTVCVRHARISGLAFIAGGGPGCPGRRPQFARSGSARRDRRLRFATLPCRP